MVFFCLFKIIFHARRRFACTPPLTTSRYCFSAIRTIYRFFLYCLLLYELVSVGWIAYCTRLSVVYRTKTSGRFSTVVSPPPCRTNRLLTTMPQAPQATCCTAAATWFYTIIHEGEHTKCIQTWFVWRPWEETGTQKKHIWSPGGLFFFILRSTWYSNLAKLNSVWKRYFPTSMTIFKREKNRILPESKRKRLNWCLSIRIRSTVRAIVLSFKSPIQLIQQDCNLKRDGNECCKIKYNLL